jgi:hypothetical protein
MIQIHGLTPEQVEMLDIIWSFDSQEELQEFIDRLDSGQRHQYQALSNLVIMAVLDEHIDEMTEFPEASEVLLGFM